MGRWEGEKRKEGRFSPSALSLFRFHLSPFRQKRLILRLVFIDRQRVVLRYMQPLGGYVPPETPNWHPVLKKIPLKLIPRARNGPIFYTPFWNSP